ncbi:MAG: radical SAM protein [Nitrospiria bacterium]
MPPFSALYIEEQCRDLPRVRDIIRKCSGIPCISCGNYSEVFNPVAQNFRLQKSRPGLIVARKRQGFVLPAPPAYGFGNGHSYYFSHMLNCPYDCRYCFLQGMYRSAHYVLFVNYEDFEAELAGIISDLRGERCYFYSGYDCDSLAFESWSRFASHFLRFFEVYPQATLELRTKSTQVRTLLRWEALRNCIVAMSFTPENVAGALEHRTPSIDKRINTLNQLQRKGWPVALRFEPLIYHEDYRRHYQKLFRLIFNALNPDTLHSVSLGMFRMPETYFKNIVKRYPDEPLFADSYVQKDGVMSYSMEIEAEMIEVCETLLFEYIPKEIYYRCKKD